MDFFFWYDLWMFDNNWTGKKRIDKFNDHNLIVLMSFLCSML